MFVVCFGDGLGNQMFQYAFYTAMKKKYPDNHVMADICNFYGSVNNHNGYELEKVFGIKMPVCDERTASALADYTPHSSHKVLNRLYQARRILFGNKESFITQDDPTVYYPEVFVLNRMKSYMLRGNWINEKYFEDFEKELKEGFSFVAIEDDKNKQIGEKIKSCNSVSVHVRRGDYLNTNMRQANLDYYKEALSMIEEKVENPMYFLFSDDSDYIAREFSFLPQEKYEIIDWNRGADSFRDMQLMSMCRHNIAANSTFSFWGAYLNSNEERIIIAPKVAAEAYRNPFACKSWTLI